jgi:hypothetical protein
MPQLSADSSLVVFLPMPNSPQFEVLQKTKQWMASAILHFKTNIDLKLKFFITPSLAFKKSSLRNFLGFFF